MSGARSTHPVRGHRGPVAGHGAETAAAVAEVVDLVRRVRVPGALNIYDEADCLAWGDEPGEADRRAQALRDHLAARWAAPTVLVGEAPGRNGARRTGVPFTSPRQLWGSGPAEATATTVRRVLLELGNEDSVLLWNASMLFPPGNRDPRPTEVEACAPALALVCRGRRVLAIGRFAQAATGAPYIRHPSHGGAACFSQGLRSALGPDACRPAADRTLRP